MGNLLDLITALAPTAAVTTSPAPLIDITRATFAKEAQPASESQQTQAAPIPNPLPAAERAPETASEPTRNTWTITRGGRPICCMVSAPCTRTEALAEAGWRWPDADILER